MKTTEMSKSLDDIGVNIIHELLNDICKISVIPSSMNGSTFIRLPRKPKATMCAENSTIKVMRYLLKVILKVVLVRNIQEIEK